jgi:rhodanese-related sulfurtransferase
MKNMESKTKISIYVFMGLVLFLVIGSFFIFNSKTKVNKLNVEEFEGLINENVFSLQVHTPYYAEIEGTDLVLEDWENIGKYLDKLPLKNEPIAVYCRSGRMSGIVSQELIDLGYTMVYDLEGGMNAWESSGREVIIND